MSKQTGGLRWTVKTIRQHKILVSAMTVAGIVLGTAFAVLRPPLPSGTALVVIPQNAPNIATEVVIVSSEPVLADAQRNISPAMSLQTLEAQVQVKSLTSGVISVTAKGTSAAQAESAANAVANSYIHYVSQARTPVGHLSAQLLQSATTATGSGQVEQDIIDGLLGALAGLVAGIIVAGIAGRLDRRLRGRDDIAYSIGVPVLASVPVDHPSDAAGWTKLLDDYEPGAVVGWRLRQALQALGFTGGSVSDRPSDGAFSLTVLSMTSDTGAVALGPQLAVFAASTGLPTVLIVGPQPDTSATAALWTACAALPDSVKRPSCLQTIAADSARPAVPQEARLVIVVATVDGKAPQMPEVMPTAATVLAVSAGAGTAEQFARLATVAAADGSDVVGFLVADPDMTDTTTGWVPRPARPVQRSNVADRGAPPAGDSGPPPPVASSRSFRPQQMTEPTEGRRG